jgi:hypothetical protein
VIVNRLHHFIVLARFLIEFDAKIEKNELKYIFLIFSTAILEFVFHLLVFVELTILIGQERMAYFVVDD